MIEAGQWKPVGVPAMEPAADMAVRARGSALVVAGSGTGKTELLGQRAAFLLQTGGRVHPRRILAISFKRDAASNLRDRVERRCGRTLAGALDSMTFDAFAKQILDRFSAALPPHLALGGTYGIAPFTTRASFNELQRFAVEGLGRPGHAAHWAKTLLGKEPTAQGIYGVGQDEFTQSVQALCLHPISIGSYAAFLQLVQLRANLTGGDPMLAFPMIGRMNDAEWWSFDRDPSEGHSIFFVAASRARESLTLTRCGTDRSAKIKDIFALLDKAGVRQVRTV